MSEQSGIRLTLLNSFASFLSTLSNPQETTSSSKIPGHPIEDQGLQIKGTRGIGNKVQGSWEWIPWLKGKLLPELVFQEIF